MRALGLLLLFAIACTPDLADGVYGCPDGVCPEGFYCGADARCHRGAAPTIECVVDGHCDDGEACTADRCIAGRCEHPPIDGACDDGNFCNGADRCEAGACVNPDDAVPPCDACDPMAPEPCDCGQLGDRCCADEQCASGAVCAGGTCLECGVVGAPCCVGAECPGLGAICEAAQCVECGTRGIRCCNGRCAPGLECSNADTCEPPPPCSGVMCDPLTEICIADRCVACGNEGDRCCAGGACAEDGLACDFTSGTCATCGKQDQICCAVGAPCGSGLACDGVHCRTCGSEAGQPCCPLDPGTPRCAGPRLVCDSMFGPGTCVHCGAEGDRCCPGSAAGGGECSDASGSDLGVVCVAGTCRSECGEVGEPCCRMLCGPDAVCDLRGCVPL